jgi:hypothetical protein
MKINFSNIFLNDVFYCKNHLSPRECENLTYFIDKKTDITFNKNNSNHNILFTNKYDDDYFNDNSKYIDDNCRNFIIQHCLTPRINFKHKISQIKKKLKLYNNNYVVIHIRTKDWEMCDLNKHINLINDISNKHIYGKKKSKILLISNNKKVLDSIHLPYIIKTGFEVGHTGLYLTSNEENMNTLIEFMLMRHCKKIYQISYYSWGSGFSDIINKIFKVPIERYKISDD